jgi:hypothetical protein
MPHTAAAAAAGRLLRGLPTCAPYSLLLLAGRPAGCKLEGQSCTGATDSYGGVDPTCCSQYCSGNGTCGFEY